MQTARKRGYGGTLPDAQMRHEPSSPNDALRAATADARSYGGKRGSKDMPGDARSQVARVPGHLLGAKRAQRVGAVIGRPRRAAELPSRDGIDRRGPRRLSKQPAALFAGSRNGRGDAQAASGGAGGSRAHRPARQPPTASGTPANAMEPSRRRLASIWRLSPRVRWSSRVGLPPCAPKTWRCGLSGNGSRFAGETSSK